MKHSFRISHDLFKLSACLIELNLATLYDNRFDKNNQDKNTKKVKRLKSITRRDMTMLCIKLRSLYHNYLMRYAAKFCIIAKFNFK